MIKNKIICSILIFMVMLSTIFSFSDSYAATGSGTAGNDTLTVEELRQRLYILQTDNPLELAISELLLGFGDMVTDYITFLYKDEITIDRLIFNKILTLDANFFEFEKKGLVPSTTEFFCEVINEWYNLFKGVAIVAYLVVLIVVGMKIMLGVAGSKAKAHDILIKWGIGMAILFLFPYVMKYVVIINDSIVNIIQAKSSDMGYGEPSGTGTQLAGMTYNEASPLYGKYDFGGLLGSNNDMMVMTRQAAVENEATNQEAQIGLAIVYLILVGQMLAVLVMYYNRAFMVAFLILIFPLVAMTYVLDKLGDGKNQSFEIWFKEFMVNIIIQLFHAVVYLLVTGAGIRSYIDSGGKNFIFMILCVLFLFEGEKILRSIFNLKSRANTIGDLAASGAMVMAMAQNSTKLLKKDKSDMGSAQDKEENSAAQNRMKSKTKSQQDNEKAATAALESKQEQGLSTDSFGEYQGKDREPKGVSTPKYDGENARDKVLTGAMKRRLKGGLATGAVSFSAGVVGATMESTRVLANGYDKPGEVIGAISAGKSLGKTLATPLTKGVNTIERMHEGRKLAKNIASGKMDKELGIDKIGIPQVPPTLSSDDVDINQISEQNGVNMQEVYRKALEAQAKAAVWGGKAKGEIAYYDYLEKHLKK